MNPSRSKPIFDAQIPAIDALAERRYATVVLVFPVDARDDNDAHLSTNVDTETVVFALKELVKKLEAGEHSSSITAIH